MGKKPKRGRPVLPEGAAKEARWIFRLLPSEAAEIDAAVKRAGKSKSVWIREALMAAARANPSKDR